MAETDAEIMALRQRVALLEEVNRNIRMERDHCDAHADAHYKEMVRLGKRVAELEDRTNGIIAAFIHDDDDDFDTWLAELDRQVRMAAEYIGKAPADAGEEE